MPKSRTINLAKFLYFASVIIVIQIWLAKSAIGHEIDHYYPLLKDSKNAKNIYAELVKDGEHHLGQPKYDFMLGLAAQKSGLYHEAIFAFERVLLVEPGNDRARTELAFTYFLAGDDEASKKLFLQVLKRNPPTAVKNNINKLLVAINKRISSRDHMLTGHIEFKQGWDSNINTATSSSEVKILGITFTIDEAGKPVEDTFTGLETSANYTYKQNKNVAWFANYNFVGRENNAEDFDTQVNSIQIGPMINTSFGRLRFPLQHQSVRLNTRTYQRANSLSTELTRFHESFSSSYFLQHSQIRYPESSVQDVDTNLLGLSLSTASKAAVNYYATLFVSSDSALDDSFAFNAKSSTGIQAGINWSLNRWHVLQPRILYQSVEYEARHPFFSVLREDEYTSYSLKWLWRLDSSWTATTSLETVSNDSTVTLYQYERDQLYFSIKRSF